jgi:hypothetical protein
MKRAFLYGLALVFVLSVVVGCGGKAKSPIVSGIDVPEWYLNPEGLLVEKYGNEASYFYGTGQATKEVASLAKQTADSRAVMEVARQVGLEAKGKIQDYMAQSGATGDDPGVLEFTESVSKQLAEANMVGCKVIQRAVSKDGKSYFALAVYSLADAQRIMAEQVQQAKADYMNNQKALFNEFKARQAFEALDADSIAAKAQPRGGDNASRD